MKITIRQWKAFAEESYFPLNKIQRLITKLFGIRTISGYRVQASFECDLVIPIQSILQTEHNNYLVLSGSDGKYKCEVTNYTNYIETCVKRAIVLQNQYII